MVRLIAALMAVLLVCGVLAAQAQKTSDKKTSDDAITDFVRLKLASDPDVKGGALEAAVKNGVVTLSGVVETERQRDKAAKLAKKVKGVKQVINNITLKDKTAPK